MVGVPSWGGGRCMVSEIANKYELMGNTCRVFGVAIRVTDRYRFNILLSVSTCSHAKTNKTRGKTLGCHAIVKWTDPISQGCVAPYFDSMRFLKN